MCTFTYIYDLFWFERKHFLLNKGRIHSNSGAVKKGTPTERMKNEKTSTIQRINFHLYVVFYNVSFLFRKNENKCTSLSLIFGKITQFGKLMPNQGERNFAQLVILIKKPYWIHFVPSSNSTMAGSVKSIPGVTNCLRSLLQFAMANL